MSGPLLRLLVVVVVAGPFAASACAPAAPASFPCNDDEDCATNRGYACDATTSRCTLVGEGEGEGEGDADPPDAGRSDDAGTDGGGSDAGPHNAGRDDAGPDDAGADDDAGASEDAGPPCPCEAPFVCGSDPTVCLEPSCGNGVLDDDEQCDDANSDVDDGCEGCVITAGWRCERQPSVCALASAIVDASGNDAFLRGAIADVQAQEELTHVFIDGSLFSWRPNQAGLSVTSGSVTLVGYNGVVFSPDNDGPAVSVSGGASLTLIGVHIRTESGGGADEGAVAEDEGTVLRIVDSVVGPTQTHGVVVTNSARLELVRSHVRTTGGGGIQLDTASYWIENSIVSGCGGTGLYTNSSPDTGSLIRYSTFSGNNGGGVACNADDTPLLGVVSWGNGGDDVSMDKCVPSHSNIGGIEAAGTNISEQPLFVDPASSDYRLQPGSPGVDQGDPAAFPRRDVDGRLRPAGAGPDMGAHEVWP